MIRLQPEDVAEIRDNYFLVRCGFQRQRQRQPRTEAIEHVEIAESLLRLPVSSIKRPEHVPVETVRSDKFLFGRAIADLRADERRVSLPISHGTSYGRANYQSTVFSTRVKTDFAANVRRPRPFQTRPEKLHSKCVDLCPTTTPPIWTKPTHDFYYGDLSKFDSGLFGEQPKFAPNPLKRFKGERPYLVFEPTPAQIKQWTERYTKNGEFKKVSYTNEFNRLQRMVSKQKFYGGGTESDSRGYSGIILGKPYLGQLQIPLYQDQLHPPNSPSSLDSIFPTRVDSTDQIVWTSSVRPLGFYGVTPCTPPGIRLPEIDWTCIDAEEALKAAADYDPKLHRELRHLYQYWYKYYPADRNMSETFSETRNTIPQPKSRDVHAEVRAEWDTAIRVTFGVTPLRDAPQTPPSGFYVIHKMSEQATTRVYLVLPNPPPPDAWDDEEGPMWVSEDGELGGPPLVGKPDIEANIRSTAAAVRSKHVNEMTIRRHLGKRVFPSDGGPKMTHIRFYQERGKLMWDLGYTSDVSVSA
jgi:hypothetical protein